MDNSLTEDRDIQNAQWEADDSIGVYMNNGLTANEADKERKVVRLGQCRRFNRCEHV